MLDEPLTGLDAGSARQVKDLLAARVREGATIILTTHILEVAERIADRIGILAHGRLIAEGTLDRIARRGRGPREPRGPLPRPDRRRGTRGVNLRPGTFVSFVAHDLRLGARGFAGMFGALPARRVAAILVAALVGLHLVAWPVALWFGGLENGPDGDKFLTAAMRSGVFFVLPWVVASTMTAVTRMLYQRGDLDLLFASPARPRDALAARLFAQAIEAVASVGLLLLPLADACALQGRPHWLALYPALFACGLFGAGLGLMLALALFFAVGPRRARVVSQIGATLVGASAVLSAQVVAMLPNSARAWLFDALALQLWRRCAAPPRHAARTRGRGRARGADRLDGAGARHVRSRGLGFRRRFRAGGAAIGRRPVGARARAHGSAVSRPARTDAAAQGASSALARSLAALADDAAGSLHASGRGHPLAQRRRHGHGGRRLRRRRSSSSRANSRARSPGSRFPPRTRRNSSPPRR